MKITIFIKNTVILIFTTLLLRTVGIIFRTYLADKIGSEGMGVYQLIFSVYMLAATFAVSGVCTAVTRLVSENLDNGKRAIKQIMKKAVSVTLLVAIFSSVVVFFGANFIANVLLKEPRAVLSLKILSFSLPFMGLSSSIRGYFIACRKTAMPSISQVVEQAVRIGTILFCLYKTKGLGLTYSAAAVLLGDTVAETVSFFTSYILYRIDLKTHDEGSKIKGIYKKIMSIALPITGCGYLSTTLHTAENLLVPLNLTKYYQSKERGLQLFGAVRGMAMPILFFPAGILNSISTMLIPEVSEAAAKGRGRELNSTITKTISITGLLSVLTAILFLFFGYDIAELLYKDRDVGYILRVLAPIVPFMYMENVASGILKGLDCQMNMLGYNLFDTIIRIATVVIILPRFGINGYLGIMITSNFLTSSLCFRQLKLRTGLGLDYVNLIMKPVFCGILGGGAGWLVSLKISAIFPKLIIEVVAAISVFLIMANLFGLFNEYKKARIVKPTLALKSKY